MTFGSLLLGGFHGLPAFLLADPQPLFPAAPGDCGGLLGAALALRLRQVPHPQRDRTLRAAQLHLDLVVRPALEPELPGLLAEVVLRVRALRPLRRRLSPARRSATALSRRPSKSAYLPGACVIDIPSGRNGGLRGRTVSDSAVRGISGRIAAERSRSVVWASQGNAPENRLRAPVGWRHDRDGGRPFDGPGRAMVVGQTA